MNADWWNTAHKAPGGMPRPGAVDGLYLVGTAWTLTWKEHTAKAEIWAAPNVGMDLRYSIDGQLHSTELFRGVEGGTRATQAALDKRDELQAKGWA